MSGRSAVVVASSMNALRISSSLMPVVISV
jgi:hypothetical protein